MPRCGMTEARVAFKCLPPGRDNLIECEMRQSDLVIPPSTRMFWPVI